MRNSSQKAGCIRRSPASHCCQVRQVVCTSAPAAVCESPAASRAALTSSGAGLDEGPFGPLFGWLGIFDDSEIFGAESGVLLSCIVDGKIPISAGESALDFRHVGTCTGELGSKRVYSGGGLLFRLDAAAIVDFEGLGHFLLQPLLPRGAVGKQCASHELNYTRNERKCKKYFDIFSLGCGETAKPSN